MSLVPGDAYVTGLPARSGLRLRFGWLFWTPWVLGAAFAACCIVLVLFTQALRRESAAASRELQEASRKAAALRGELATWQGESHVAATNFQRRLADLQRQVLQRALEFERQKTAMENQLKDKTAAWERERADLERQLAARKSEIELLQAAVTKATAERNERLAPVTVWILRSAEVWAAPARVTVLWDAPAQRGLLHAENLPTPPAGQDYQLWLHDPKYPIPISAGVLPASASDTLRYFFRPVFPIEKLIKVTLSLERQGGMTKPQGRVVLTSQ